MRRPDDRAASSVIAEIVLVAVGITGATVVYALYQTDHNAAPPPVVGLTDDGPNQGGTKSFTVAAAMPRLDWGHLAIVVGGETFTYDGTLAADKTFCVVASGTSCVATGTWDGTTDVVAGQQLRIHGNALAGNTLTLRHVEINSILYSKVLGF